MTPTPTRPVERWKRPLFGLLAGLMLTVLPAGAITYGVELVPVDPSVEIYGVAALAQGRGFEILSLRILAPSLADGTMLRIYVTREGYKEALEISRAEIVLGSSLTNLDSRRAVSPVFPFKGLTTIIVRTARGKEVLRGTVPPEVGR